MNKKNLVLFLLFSFFLTGVSYTTGFTKETPTIKWTYTLDNAKAQTSMGDIAIGPDGTIYTASGAVAGVGVAVLYAINPNGTKKWNFPVCNFWMTVPVIDKDGTIYIYSDPLLYALNPDGTKKWETKAYPTLGFLALGSNGILYGSDFTSQPNMRKIYAIKNDGTLLWSSQYGPYQFSLGTNNEIYYFVEEWQTRSYYIHCLDPNNGSIKWKYKTDEGWSSSAGVAIAPDETIVVNLPSSMIALNKDGTFKWKYAPTPRSKMPCIDGKGRIYITSGTSGNAIALNPNGTLWWKKDAKVAENPCSLAKDGTIYFTAAYISPNLPFAALNADGSEKWRIDVAHNGSSPAIGDDGTIYVAGGNIVTAIKGTLPLLREGWARAKHDNRNTSCLSNASGSPGGGGKEEEKGKRIFEHYTEGEQDGGDVRMQYWHAQTFSVESSHTIQSVKLKMYRVGNAGSLVVSIRDTDSSGHPTGADLTVGSIDTSIITPSKKGDWYEITFNSYNLQRGKKYAITVRAPSGGGGNSVKWMHDGDNPTYLGGNRETSADNGSIWGSDLKTDYLFEVWGESTEPPPSTNQIVIKLQIGNNKAYINEVEKVLDVPPMMVKGRTLVPFRFIGEALQAKVGFTLNVDTGRVAKVTYELGSTFITLFIGQQYAEVNGNRITLDIAPMILEGRTLVPLRFVAESLGCKTEWEATTKTIIIKYNP